MLTRGFHSCQHQLPLSTQHESFVEISGLRAGYLKSEAREVDDDCPGILLLVFSFTGR
jgi:hypothetical protein